MRKVPHLTSSNRVTAPAVKLLSVFRILDPRTLTLGALSSFRSLIPFIPFTSFNPNFTPV